MSHALEPRARARRRGRVRSRRARARRGALAAALRTGGIDEGDILARLVHARALDALGRRGEARIAIDAACKRIRERADRLGPSLRSDWLAMPENARALRLFRDWSEA